MSESVSLQHAGSTVVGTVQPAEYADGNLAVQLVEDHGEIYATLSANCPEFELATGEFIFKNYSENEGLLESLEELGIVKRTGRYVINSFVQMPVCRLC